MTKVNNVKAFTLLEVLVALTIVGMSLGALLALLGGSKRLSWQALEQLESVQEIRPLIGVARLMGRYTFTYRAEPPYHLETGRLLPVTARQTVKTPVALQTYQIVNEQNHEIIEGVRWGVSPVMTSEK